MEENKINESFDLNISDTIGINNLKEIFTIDPFYDNNIYNESLQALKNNKIKYEEFILLKNPYNFYLRLEDKKLPVMLNYEMISRSRWEFLVTKVRPLVPRDILKLYRFNRSVSSIKEYINNDVFSEALKSKTTIVFNYKNREQLTNLSKKYGKIYIIGKYYNTFRLAVCFNPEIKNVLLPNDVLITQGEHKLGELELNINKNILKSKEKIIKYTSTPYFKDGNFFPTSPVSPIKV